MAPKKSIADFQRFPPLRLEFENGPASGQIADYEPRSRIHIGRVVRGNTLSIKDAGISSKHLRIQVETGTNLGKDGWAITDLGSSNGTFLNGEQLEPTIPALLSDGDVIKIGEVTTILVKLKVNDHENVSVSTNLRKSTRHKAKKQADANLGATEQLPDVEQSDVAGGRTRKGAGRKNIAKETLVQVRENIAKETLLQVTENMKLEPKDCEEGEIKCLVPEDPACSSGVIDVNAGTVVDLKKMTLGEWFDHLEVNLPQQIIHETEEMLTEMKQKAARLREFMLHRKNDKRGAM